MSAGCIGVGDEFVVGQFEAEDVGVDYDDAAGIGAVADYVGVEAVDEFFSAFGLAGVDGALVCGELRCRFSER